MVRQKPGWRQQVYKLGATHQCYSSWYELNRRCTAKHREDYKEYGGRGIKVCRRWSADRNDGKGFLNFFLDMGNPPPGMTLDRRNVDGNYEKKNCRWASRSDQLRNRRKYGSLTNFTPDELGKHIVSMARPDLIRLIARLLRT